MLTPFRGVTFPRGPWSHSLALAVALGSGCTGTVSDDPAGVSIDPGAAAGNNSGRMPGPSPAGPAPVLVPVVPVTSGDRPVVLPGPVPPPQAGGCAALGRLGASPLRRLTHTEYVSTVKDLLKLDVMPDFAFPKEGEIWGLTNNVSQQTMSASLVERYYNAAEKISATGADNAAKLSGCDVAAKSEDICAKALIDEMGPRAYRRPLIEDERQGLLKVFSASRAGADFKTGTRGIIEALLVAPQFLFRTETGAAAEMAGAVGWWETLRRIYSEWLEFDRLTELRKDSGKFPEFTPALQVAMRGELDRFVDFVFEKKRGSLESLLTSAESFVEGTLGKLYGLTNVTGTAFQSVQLDPMRRAGVLSRAGFLSSVSAEDGTGLVHRGQFQADHAPALCPTQRRSQLRRLSPTDGSHWPGA